MSKNTKIIITLWLLINVIYGAYLYNQKMTYCLSNWVPTGLNQAEATDLCFNSFLHSFSLFFIPATVVAFILYKLWDKNKAEL